MTPKRLKVASVEELKSLRSALITRAHELEIQISDMERQHNKMWAEVRRINREMAARKNKEIR